MDLRSLSTFRLAHCSDHSGRNATWGTVLHVAEVRHKPVLMILTVRLPDVWVNESDRLQQKTKVVHLSKLPTDTAVLLDPNIYR